ncbi:gp013 [Erwinia phage vB_EamP-S6]|uniref:Gp013 n=1 Tax=Erwinia phage vB_EamP-S6 TaxID=1051675 RepID=G0YQA5_9CAUD|nr:gp013 [Erwinia phage vB_EamP-S6]AEJ81532.1 gp013 [Erwinia phage vB_EamP-S6]
MVAGSPNGSTTMHLSEIVNLFINRWPKRMPTGIMSHTFIMQIVAVKDRPQLIRILT